MMGWFGFKRGSHAANAKSTKEVEESREKQQDLDNKEDNNYISASKTSDNYDDSADSANSSDYDGEIQHGPWDVNDDNVPDYSDYLDLGSFYLPFLQGISLRLKKHRETNHIMGVIATYGSSSVSIEAFAAPKSSGIWDDIRKELIESNDKITEIDGAFGKELLLPVSVEGKTVQTRFVGVDGSRWMLRGIFSGQAAEQSMKNSDETLALNGWFSNIVVNRGDEPMAPRDLIPMHEPITAKQRAEALRDALGLSEATVEVEDATGESSGENSGESGDSSQDSILKRDDRPLGKDQQVEVKTTLTRGPMFSEIR
ncbi:hypothetical protein HMPREF3230_01261 [Gardnerella vaginalis]|uniref:DUF3710 domain-containing protein n=2 Tax=Bifidobacteriaceae TaxID=31953 RepID=A0A135Z2H8_GARVA|nr:hypothetical protein HMPREF3230_01261 [Gardnerella vaginalis]